jgi:hypothetical protein
MIIKTINVRAVQIYVEKDKEGYLSLATDGYPAGGGLDEIIKILRAAQDKDDLEMDSMDAERDLEMRMAVRY